MQWKMLLYWHLQHSRISPFILHFLMITSSLVYLLLQCADSVVDLNKERVNQGLSIAGNRKRHGQLSVFFGIEIDTNQQNISSLPTH